jgi:hypothetical protein
VHERTCDEKCPCREFRAIQRHDDRVRGMQQRCRATSLSARADRPARAGRPVLRGVEGLLDLPNARVDSPYSSEQHVRKGTHDESQAVPRARASSPR